jgi:hypothetical protein
MPSFDIGGSGIPQSTDPFYVSGRIPLPKRIVQAKLRKEETRYDIKNVSRPEDEGNDLYKVFNRVQEGIIRGGFNINATTKSGTKKVRKISNMLKDLDINGQLWVLAEEFAEPALV